MTFDNDEEERKYATAVFVNIQDRGFQQILRLRCRHEIAEAAPPEAIDAVLSMEPIPPLWAHWVLYYHHKSLTDAQVQKLINTIATNVELSYWTLHDCTRWLATPRDRTCRLTDEQVQQLIDKIATDKFHSRITLRCCSHSLTDKQHQQLKNAIRGNNEI